MAEHNQIVEDYQNDLREYEDKASMNDVSLYKIFNKPFIDFLYEIYEPSLIKESFHWFTEIGKERPASLPGQLLNK